MAEEAVDRCRGPRRGRRACPTSAAGAAADRRTVVEEGHRSVRVPVEAEAARGRAGLDPAASAGARRQFNDPRSLDPAGADRAAAARVPALAAPDPAAERLGLAAADCPAAVSAVAAEHGPVLAAGARRTLAAAQAAVTQAFNGPRFLVLAVAAHVQVAGCPAAERRARAAEAFQGRAARGDPAAVPAEAARVLFPADPVRAAASRAAVVGPPRAISATSSAWGAASALAAAVRALSFLEHGRVRAARVRNVPAPAPVKMERERSFPALGPRRCRRVRDRAAPAHNVLARGRRLCRLDQAKAARARSFGRTGTTVPAAGRAASIGRSISGPTG